MFVIDSSLRLLEHPGERVRRAASHLLDGRLEFPALLPLDRKHVPRGVDAAALAVDPGKYGGSPLTVFPAQWSEDPHSIYLGRRENLRDRLGKALPPAAARRRLAVSRHGHAWSCSHCSV